MIFVKQNLPTVLGYWTGYGRNILEQIGDSSLELYDQMSKAGAFKDGNYSQLLELLAEAGLEEVVDKLQKAIDEHTSLAHDGNYMHIVKVL